MWVRQKIEKELSHAAPQFPPLHRRTRPAEPAGCWSAAIGRVVIPLLVCFFSFLTSR